MEQSETNTTTQVEPQEEPKKCTTEGCPGVFDHIGPHLPEMENPWPG